MRLISHRGNISGRNPEKENSPEYITNALDLGFDVEVDIWYVYGKYFLGHDNPTFEVTKDFINSIKDRSWFHCKNEDALSNLNDDFDQINFFWHDSDKYTITSMGYIWAFPGEKIIKNSIILFPENYPENKNQILLSSGICSDYIEDYSSYKNIEKIEHDEYNLLLKIKNPTYDFFTHSKEFKHIENTNIRTFSSKLIPIREATDHRSYHGHEDHIFSTIIRFNKNKNKLIEENVFIYSFTPRYFHNVVELFPKLIKLKKIDPNFVFIFTAWQHEDIEENFLPEYKNDSKDWYYNYIIEFLNLLNIKHKFIYKENFDEFSFKNSYIFYEKYNEEVDGFNQKWDEHLNVKGYTHCHMFYSPDAVGVTKSLMYMWDFFNGFDNNLNLQQHNCFYPKKIFISRKNFYSRKDTNILNKNNKIKEEAVEKVFEENGYHIINMEDFTFLEQLRLSYNAEVITCFVGASVLNTFSSNKNIKIFYLNPLNKEYNNELHLKDYYKFIFDIAGIENSSYDIDMNTLEFSELRNILSNL